MEPLQGVLPNQRSNLTRPRAALRRGRGARKLCAVRWTDLGGA
jgi:hypothetical protein